jgi:hypothetical protein
MSFWVRASACLDNLAKVDMNLFGVHQRLWAGRHAAKRWPFAKDMTWALKFLQK